MQQKMLLGCLPEIAPNGDFYLSEDIEVIIQSIFVIINTKLESRVWQPEFGCRLQEYIWDLLDETTLENMKTDLMNALKRWEPRISVTSLIVEPLTSLQDQTTPTVKIDIKFVFDRQDYSHTFEIGPNTSMMDLNIYQLKFNKRQKVLEG